MSDPKKVKMGKKSRAQGGIFETRVRAELEEDGWIVDKWSNNIKISNGKGCPEFAPESYELCQAKPKYLFINGGMRMVGNNSGFPDFIIFKPGEVGPIVGVESKMTGDLDRIEKAKCKWLLDRGIFDKILIAEKTKVKNRVVIIYHDFKEKYKRFYK